MSKNLTKRVVGASVLAVAIGMATGTSAQTLGTALYPANTFAIELNYNSAALPLAGVAVTVAPITTNLGFGVSATQNRYIRYILSSNASFHVALTNAELTDTTAAFGGVTVVSGGSAANSCVVFQVTGAAPNGNAQNDVISFASSTLDVTSNAAPVTITYTLHETATSASCTTGDNTTILNTPVTGNVATFSPSIAFTAPATYLDTADVQFSLPPALPFGGFVAGGAPADAVSTTNAGLANISLAVATYAGLVPVTPTQANGVAPITLPLLASKAVMTVTSADGGTFAATSTNNGANPPVGTVVLQTSAACNVAAAPAWTVGLLNASGSILTYTNAAAPVPFSFWLCYSVTGKTALPAGDYMASLTLTPQANVTLEAVPTIAVGTINHNGTVLQAPWFTTYSGYQSRFFLTNNGSFTAPYTASFLTESGITAAAGPGASGTIAPGTTVEIDSASLVTLTGGTRATVIFNVAAPNATIQGAYNVVNATTGSITVSPMIRPGTN